MDEDRLDLSPLDPSTDAVHWEALLSAIRQQAAPELAWRASRTGVLGLLGRWAWPALAAASIVAALSGGALALIRPQQTWVPVVRVIGVNEPVQAWLEEGRSPTTADLLVALEGGNQ